MNTNPKIKESLLLKKKAIALLSKAIAKIILKFRLPRNEFIASLDENLVLQAKIQDPEASNVSIAIRTGIDRRYISKYLKGDIPETKPDKMAVILEDIRWTAHKFYNGKTIPKTGPFRTFQSICEQRASGTLTYKAILKEFVENGYLKEFDKNIEIINLNFNIRKSEINYSQLTATQVNRLTDTLIFNSNKVDKKDKLIQRTVYTTQVNPVNYTKLHINIESLLNDYFANITDEIIKFEDDVDVGTYPQYGISFLEYKTEE
jgi:hypothetical protein